MTAIGAPAIVPQVTPQRAPRTGVLGTLLLDDLCGLPAGESSAHCNRIWCGYFDEAFGRCALLEWDVPGRMGPEALRWFVAHRTAKSFSEDYDLLLARTCAL